MKYLRVSIDWPGSSIFVDTEVADDTTDTEAGLRAEDTFEDRCVYSHDLLDEKPDDWDPDEIAY